MSATIPEPDRKDLAFGTAKGAIAGIPIVGNIVSELLPLLIKPSVERRREAWMRSVGEKLEELAKKGVDIEALAGNEQFVSAVLEISESARKTHRVGKLTALRNAIVNIAKGVGPDEGTQELLLSAVHDLSELHLRVLRFAQAPTSNEQGTGSLGRALQERIPTLNSPLKKAA